MDRKVVRGIIMDIKEHTEKSRVGIYSSEIKTITIDGIDIDNASKRTIYENGKKVEVIKEYRKLPEKVKPPKIVLAPTPAAELTLIDVKNPFWHLKDKVTRDITCWVVQTDKGETILYDAVTGDKVGEGVPPPTDKATSISGYHQSDWPDPWKKYRANAAYWFNRWGFTVWNTFAPSKSYVGMAISNREYKYHYALAHGSSNRFQVRSNEYVYASDVSGWMGGSGGGRRPPAPSRPAMWFTFLGHCGGMVNTGRGSLSYAFRKGQLTNTVTIGYYNAHLNASAWAKALPWQKKLFSKMNTGVTWKAAFDYANVCYPVASPIMRFLGDTSMKLRPIEDDGGDDGDDEGDGNGDNNGGNGGGSSGGPRGRGGGSSGGSDGNGGGGSGGGPRGRR